MDETIATATTQPGAQPGSAPGETLVLTVDDAAHLIGITPQAVRKRIAKGTLAAYREGRAWRVVLNRGSSATDETATTQPSTQPPANLAAQPAQPQAAQLAALVEPFTGPLVARIEALSREAERERTRADEAERERDRLRAALGDSQAKREAPSAAQEPHHATEPANAGADTSRSWWRFWEWW